MSGHVLVLLERCNGLAIALLQRDSYRPGQVLCLIRLPKEALDKLRPIFNHSPYLGLKQRAEAGGPVSQDERIAL